MVLPTRRHSDRVFSAGLEASPFQGSLITNSWKRCLDQYRLDPEKSEPARVLSNCELRDARGPSERLLNVAESELDILHKLVVSSGYVVMLTDASGVAVASRSLHHQENDFRKWGLWAGAVWSEECEGTNGVGTCLAEQRPVTVHRDEHFRSRYIGLTCTVAPIFDPYGRIAGGLDISACRDDIDSRIIAFAEAATNAAARRIEEACFKEAFPRCWIVSPGDFAEGKALLAFDPDGRVAGANRSARSVFGISDGSLEDGVEIVETDIDKVSSMGLSRFFQDGSRHFFAISRADTYVSPPVFKPKQLARRCGRLDPDVFAGEDPELRKSLLRVKAAFAMDMPVIIFGETGTGKSSLARAIADNGGNIGPFVTLECAAISETSADAQLFGCVSDERRESSVGRILQADGGTLFLDEIGDMPLNLQSRLLHVIEKREVQAIGSDKVHPVAIRIIAATSRDLKEMVESGLFRADLYYRLSGATMTLPAMRHRADKASIVKSALRTVAPTAALSETALDALVAFHWPGNFRQLEQVLRLASATCAGNKITRDDLSLPADESLVDSPISEGTEAIEMAERAVLARHLTKNRFDVARTATKLGMSRATLYRKIKRFGL